MDASAIQAGLARLPAWSLEGNKLRRVLVFEDFRAAFAFMVQVAELAEQHQHHPDWSNSWNRVVIELWSHDVGQLTQRDFRLAAAIEGLLGSRTT